MISIQMLLLIQTKNLVQTNLTKLFVSYWRVDNIFIPGWLEFFLRTFESFLNLR